MMRIGIDCRKIADFGIGTYIRGVIGGLASIDHDDEYVLFASRDASTLLPVDPRFRHVEESSPHYSLRELFALGRAANKERLDLFHAPHYVVPFMRCPFLVTIHDLIHLHQRLGNPLAPRYARWMLRRAALGSVAVFTVSEAVKHDLIAELDCPAEKIVVTPNGIDEAFWKAATGDEAVLQRRGLERHRYFLFAGNDKPHKNVEGLIEAWCEVRRTRSDLVLVLAGRPFERFRGIDGLRLTGFVETEDLAALFRQSLAVVVPSIDEGFGLPAAEAMAAGTAIVISTAPALVEVAGDAALRADAHDARSIAAAMNRIAAEPALRAELIERGRKRAGAFSWRACAEKTRDAYRRAAMK